MFEDDFLRENRCIFKKYKPIKKIGSGSYGNVYSVLRLEDKASFAMKIEKSNCQYTTLEAEAYHLFILQGGVGIPKFITYGHKNKYNILIESLLSENLYNIFIENNRKCSIVDTCFIALQILDRLKWINSKDLIYRDIKPTNFLIGINDPNIIYIVDFGLCKKYRSSKTGKHILPKKTGKFNGTLKYASSSILQGKEPSRKDDLIALGYMLVYLLKGELPWHIDNKVLMKKNYKDLIYLKETDGNGQLFENIPEELKEYIKYTKKLKFEEDPDYSYMRSLFTRILCKTNENYKQLTFSWINPNKRHLFGFKYNDSSKKSNPHKRLFKSIEIELSRRSQQQNINFNFSKIPDVYNSINDDIKRNDFDQQLTNFQRRRKIIEKTQNPEQKKIISSSFTAEKLDTNKKFIPKKKSIIKTIKKISGKIDLNNSQKPNKINNQNKIYHLNSSEKKKTGVNLINKTYIRLYPYERIINNSKENERYNGDLMKNKIPFNKKNIFSNNIKIYSKINNTFENTSSKIYQSPLINNIYIINNEKSKIGFKGLIPDVQNLINKKIRTKTHITILEDN